MTLTEVERQTLERYTGRSKGSVNVSISRVSDTLSDADIALFRASGASHRPNS